VICVYSSFQWENHAKSLRLEEQTLQRIRERIQCKVMTGTEGTWIDWQCLLDAAALLARCRYTLQYTYPYAYYMDPGSRKELVHLFTLKMYWINIIGNLSILLQTVRVPASSVGG